MHTILTRRSAAKEGVQVCVWLSCRVCGSDKESMPSWSELKQVEDDWTLWEEPRVKGEATAAWSKVTSYVICERIRKGEKYNRRYGESRVIYTCIIGCTIYLLHFGYTLHLCMVTPEASGGSWGNNSFRSLPAMVCERMRKKNDCDSDKESMPSWSELKQVEYDWETAT